MRDRVLPLLVCVLAALCGCTDTVATVATSRDCDSVEITANPPLYTITEYRDKDRAARAVTAPYAGVYTINGDDITAFAGESLTTYYSLTGALRVRRSPGAITIEAAE